MRPSLSTTEVGAPRLISGQLGEQGTVLMPKPMEIGGSNDPISMQQSVRVWPSIVG